MSPPAILNSIPHQQNPVFIMLRGGLDLYPLPLVVWLVYLFSSHQELFSFREIGTKQRLLNSLIQMEIITIWTIIFRLHTRRDKSARGDGYTCCRFYRRNQKIWYIEIMERTCEPRVRVSVWRRRKIKNIADPFHERFAQTSCDGKRRNRIFPIYR